jgi:hypothetical protein
MADRSSRQTSRQTLTGKINHEIKKTRQREQQRINAREGGDKDETSLAQ